MPHVSSKPLHAKEFARLDDQLIAAFANTRAEARKKIYDELFTKTERIMLAKRLEILFLISKGVSTYKISKALHVSPSTVARFELAVENGKYSQSTKWLSSPHFSSSLLQLFAELASVPFVVQKRRMHRKRRK